MEAFPALSSDGMMAAGMEIFTPNLIGEFARIGNGQGVSKKSIPHPEECGLVRIGSGKSWIAPTVPTLCS